jgi:hypothetical protein
MYAEVGSIEVDRQVFDEMVTQDFISLDHDDWSTCKDWWW